MGTLNYFFNHTTRVEAVIEKIETVLEKSRNSLLEDEIRLLEESLVDLRKLETQTISDDNLLLMGRVILQLLRFFDIDIS
ncbi:MAG: hypothetical protein R2797_00910 [Gelidibacter sp.]